jgi:hypothetical protein
LSSESNSKLEAESEHLSEDELFFLSLPQLLLSLESDSDPVSEDSSKDELYFLSLLLLLLSSESYSELESESEDLSEDKIYFLSPPPALVIRISESRVLIRRLVRGYMSCSS